MTLTGFTRDFGPDQDRANQAVRHRPPGLLGRHPELDGKTLPTGLRRRRSTRTTFENKVTQVAARRPGAGRRSTACRDQPAGQPEWERDFLVVEEHLPAGDDPDRGLGPVRRPATTRSRDGVLTFYFAPDQ